MPSRTAALAALAAAALASAGAGQAHGAQLSTLIDPGEDAAEFGIDYLLVAYIEYGEGGGRVADALRGGSWSAGASASVPDPDAVALMDALNRKIAADGSGARITGLSVEYAADMRGNAESAPISYKVSIRGTLTDYNIAAAGGATGQRLVDLGWRGLSVDGPVVVGGTEINIPLSALAANEPEVHALMLGSSAADVLSMPLIHADGIRDLPLGSWHFLFDPTGINLDASQFGLGDEIRGFVVSAFTMGESNIGVGRMVEVESHGVFEADRAYAVRTVQPADIANINFIGFASDDRLGGLEIVGVTPTAPEGFSESPTGDFPVAIIYGMAGLAAAGGGAFFVFSSRQMKKEQGQGQTGIDPSRLRGYQTSASAGGYQTNRGEAQLADDASYEQTRSVYDGARDGARTPPPAVGRAQDAACGCAAAADAGSECDCQMQGHCLCDASCGCAAGTCRDAVGGM